MKSSDIIADGKTPYRVNGHKAVVLEAPVESNSYSNVKNAARIRWVGAFRIEVVTKVPLRDVERKWTQEDDVRLAEQQARTEREQRINGRLHDAGYPDTVVNVRKLENGHVWLTLRSAGVDTRMILQKLDIDTD